MRYRGVPPIVVTPEGAVKYVGAGLDFVARLASAGGSDGSYATWFEQVPGPTPGSWADAGRQGPAAGKLYELNGYADVPNVRVRVWQERDGKYYFQKRTCP